MLSYKYKIFLYLIIFLFSIKTFAIDEVLDLKLSSLSENDISLIHPILIDSNTQKVVSIIPFNNEIISLHKSELEYDERRVLKNTLKTYIKRTKALLNNIKKKKLFIENIALRNEVKSTLVMNKVFMETAYEDFKFDQINTEVRYYITKYNNNPVVITRSIDTLDTLDIDLVMSNPDNIIDTRLNRTGAIKRASVENVRSIARDIRYNYPSIKHLSAYVKSPILEENYRRMGFETSLYCN
ncbi:hypothetical protein [Photobacterium leiognathi]|uniref:hypothetical protein n=1 Tax=Photobacterium leiognathi TaxID=553611 RepID=UPI000D15A178|nr:hypothetical protein [Photobacterium leiognathi]PSW48758.1 hypothetical protein C0W50_21280 [Photobacterium leiognathi subsp. mandapamensis]